MFMGEYAHNLDAKGRIIIPAKFREELGEEVVVTRGMDCCLNIYTKEQWNTSVSYTHLDVYKRQIALPLGYGTGSFFNTVL